MPSVLPMQENRRGRSMSAICDVIVPGPAFQQNVVPSLSGPSTD